MLIPSHRHTAADLALWREYEAADMIHGRRQQLAEKVAKSLDVIREFIAAGPSYCGVSWGKDSIVVADLLCQVDSSIPLVHLRPTNHNPDCDLVRDAYLPTHLQIYSEVTVDYSDIIARDLPDEDRDRLTDERWNDGWRRVAARFGDRYLSGIRGREGRSRMMRCARWGESTERTCAPLAWWTTADVFGYLAVKNLPVHPTYACLGGGRWPRERLRTAEIGDTHGNGGGRREWTAEYYGDILRNLSR